MIELKTLRTSTHLSQNEFAELIKVPVSTYAKWEQGINKPAESQEYLMCYYLYHEGYIKTYLNDPWLSLTEIGLIMQWIRYDGPERFSENSNSEICQFFRNYVSMEEAGEIYEKLKKHYIVPRKIPRVAKNAEISLSREEEERVLYRISEKGVEILPYDAGTLRGTYFAGDTYFFFQRIEELLKMQVHTTLDIMYKNCHDRYAWDDNLSIKAKAVMNCLYYRYALNYPLSFTVEELAENYGNDFYSSIDELKLSGYVNLMKSGFYEFNTEYHDYSHGARFYIKSDVIEK